MGISPMNITHRGRLLDRIRAAEIRLSITVARSVYAAGRIGVSSLLHGNTPCTNHATR